MGRVFVRLWVGHLWDGCGWGRLDVRHGHRGGGKGLLSGRLASTLSG